MKAPKFRRNLIGLRAYNSRLLGKKCLAGYGTVKSMAIFFVENGRDESSTDLISKKDRSAKALASPGTALRQMASVRLPNCGSASIALGHIFAVASGSFLLAGCATTQADIIADVNWEVNHTRPYSHYKGADARYLKEGEAGNCYAQVYTKKVELAKRGIESTVLSCRLKSGEGHAVLVTTEGVLDNRTDNPQHYHDIGCE